MLLFLCRWILSRPLPESSMSGTHPKIRMGTDHVQSPPTVSVHSATTPGMCTMRYSNGYIQPLNQPSGGYADRWLGTSSVFCMLPLQCRSEPTVEGIGEGLFCFIVERFWTTCDHARLPRLREEVAQGSLLIHVFFGPVTPDRGLGPTTTSAARGTSCVTTRSSGLRCSAI